MPVYDVTKDNDGIIIAVGVSEGAPKPVRLKKRITVVDKHGNKKEMLIGGIEDIGVVRVVNSGG